METELIAQAVILLISLGALAKASQYVIENAVVLARYFRISEATVGFVLISVSTSLPELSVALISSSAGEGALSVGNVIGSNIADLTLVIGICAFIRPLLVKKRDMMEIMKILLITSIIPLVLIYTGNLDKFGGLLLIGIFAAYVFYVSRKKIEMEKDVNHIRRPQALRAFLLFSGGIVGVLLTSSFAVNSAVTISAMTGITKTFLGATIIALGTSLPELAVDIQAVRRGRYSLALGDAIGSAMTNLTLVLGVTALFNPVIISMSIFLTIMLFLLATNMALMYFMTTSNKITKKEGVMLIALYVIFVLVTSGVQISVAHLLPIQLPF
ncbi:MAG: sodium:calcium antiporter [Candidatus Burarchaeum sp.]|nr:sodium:calcium antiporter [Candidatus Burarchaeum sp.]MDO8340055.1 sodium:calcium antiporter [Candidatus Burarchaeum sp.]